MSSDKTLLGLDIGTSWTRCVIGSLSRDGELMIEAVNEHPSLGVKNGSIVNIEQTVKVINQVVSDAELQAGADIGSVILSIGSDHLHGISSNGVVGINNKNGEITRDDIRRSIDVARNRELPQNTEVIHTLVQDFQVDSRSGIKDPIDMLGHRLDTKVLLVIGSSPIIQNQKKCVQKAGLQVQKLMLSTLADSEVVLSQEEKEAGAIIINIGSGSTDCIAYSSGSPIYVGAIDMGGDVVTNDIAYMLQLPRAASENIKISDGSCYSPTIRNDEMIITPAVGGKMPIRLPKKELAKIMEARMAEIFSRIKQDFEESGISGPFGSGIILVGGGALLSGATELAAEIFRVPARIGFPEAINGLDRMYIDPRYTTALGLLKSEAKKYREPQAFSGNMNKGTFSGRVRTFFGKLF